MAIHEKRDAEQPGLDVSASAPTAATFEAMFVAEYASVVRLGAVLTGDVAAGEDLAQDAFIAAQARWAIVGAYSDPGAWVRRVVMNRSVSRYRRAASEARALIRLGRPQHQEPPAVHDEVWRAIRRLPGRQAQVILLTVLEDRSVTEIALMLECGEPTVRTHLLRARKRLATELKVGFDEHD
jgi:RNA polymerase sigma-70 factor (ECF subfamily)